MKKTLVALFCIFVLVACIKPDNFDNNRLEEFWNVESEIFAPFEFSGEVIEPAVTEENGMLNIFPGVPYFTRVWQDGYTLKDKGKGMYNFGIRSIPNPLLIGPNSFEMIYIQFEGGAYHAISIAGYGELTGECVLPEGFYAHKRIDIDMTKPLWLCINRDGTRLVAYYKQDVDSVWIVLPWANGASPNTDLKVNKFEMIVVGWDNIPQAVLWDDFEVDFKEMISK